MAAKWEISILKKTWTVWQHRQIEMQNCRRITNLHYQRVCLKVEKFTSVFTMPVDSRRLQGPENSFSYKLLEKKNDKEEEAALSADLQKILIGTNKVRKDKRIPSDARPLCNVTIV